MPGEKDGNNIYFYYYYYCARFDSVIDSEKVVPFTNAFVSWDVITGRELKVDVGNPPLNLSMSYN